MYVMDYVNSAPSHRKIYPEEGTSSIDYIIGTTFPDKMSIVVAIFLLLQNSIKVKYRNLAEG